jgi:hypothetical protein
VGEKSYVFRKAGPSEFARTEVKAEGADDGRMRIAGGLASGDEVVIAGALLLRQLEDRKQQ